MRRAAAGLLIVAAACDWSRPIPRPGDAGVDCPAVLGEGAPSVALDLDCKANPCAIAAREEACTLELAITGCVDATLRGTIGAGGQVIFERSEALGACTVIAPRDDGLLALLCEGDDLTCRADLYPTDKAIDADTATARIFDVEFRGPEGTAPEPLDRTDVLRGYLSDFDEAGARLAVAGWGGAYRRAKCEDETATLSFVDPEAMTVVATATAPPCLVRIAFDRQRGQLIGVSGGPAPEIDRFDLDGNLLQRTPISFPAEVSPAFTVALALDRATDLAWVTITSDEEPRFAYAIAVALESFDTVLASPRIDAFVRSSALIEAGLYASDSEGAAIERVAADGSLLQPIALFGVLGFSNDAGFVAQHLDSGKVLVSATGARAAVWVLRPGAQDPVVKTAIYYFSYAAPWAIAPWPKDRGSMAIGVTDALGEHAAQLALFDVEEARFRGQRLRIGRGLVSKLAIDPRGRMWALLPWSAELVRITPR